MILAGTLLTAPAGAQQRRWKIVGWNDLGMHCVDGNDYSIFSILPPYNNIRAQLINAEGKLVANPAGLTVTYHAVADPAGSSNRTSIGKTNFWQYVAALFKVTLPPDMGLSGHAMPGPANTPRAMHFNAAARMFAADGIPILPYDDQGRKNYYPLMRLTARDARGSALATTDVVLPVSDEMDCAVCHASGSTNTARPKAGWVFDGNRQRDYKRNILVLHDEQRDPARWPNLLAQVGYNRAGLHATAMAGTPVLCARCHLSNALPGSGFGAIRQLTTVVHAKHALVTDPANGMLLDSSNNRTACYRCHPGSETKCLRGAMGNATVGGVAVMQCQSCHGSMSMVGAATRTGWLDQPTCQGCHTGTAVRNNGEIRYTSVFEPSGLPRTAVNATFASNPNTPLPGKSLYRLSSGHGGLQCEACHGSTHAEYPSSHLNDNLQNIRFQGHEGTLIECSACHSEPPETVTGGPHGMHPVGQYWVSKHEDPAEHNPTQCQACHGLNYRGTVLSRAAANRVFNAGDFGVRSFAKGRQIGCYDCHNGPRGE